MLDVPLIPVSKLVACFKETKLIQTETYKAQTFNYFLRLEKKYT